MAREKLLIANPTDTDVVLKSKARIPAGQRKLAALEADEYDEVVRRGPLLHYPLGTFDADEAAIDDTTPPAAPAELEPQE